MTENFPLDEYTADQIAEYRDNIKMSQVAIEALLRRFVRQHQIQGRPRLAENGRELIVEVEETTANANSNYTG